MCNKLHKSKTTNQFAVIKINMRDCVSSSKKIELKNYIKYSATQLIFTLSLWVKISLQRAFLEQKTDR